ncbi:MAG: catalase [Deltaproteobacteria bacterium]|nr:catalase [Deltaproteobacteria bacterium]
MSQPSTQWSEQIPPNEEAHHTQLAEKLIASQQATRDKEGPGRALHRKQIAALHATLEVAADLPEYARQGLFAQPMSYKARVRLSNGSGHTQRDARPDVRGFAISVLDVAGESALGGPATTQDFLLIPSETFAFKTVEQFMNVALAAPKGPLAIVSAMIKMNGFFAGLKAVKALDEGLKKPFAGFFAEMFFSAAPIACGPYAARVRLKPVPSATTAATPQSASLLDDVRTQLAKGPSVHELQLQFFVDEATTPILDPTINWPQDQSPYLTVATLTIEPQALEGPEHDERMATFERGIFDPWHALAAHRPLGEIMRGRKVAYFLSQKARGL